MQSRAKDPQAILLSPFSMGFLILLNLHPMKDKAKKLIVCGDNDAPLAFESDGDIEVLARRWRVNRTNPLRWQDGCVF